MKKLIIFFSLLLMGLSVSAQSLFEYITIPRNATTGVPEWSGVVKVDSTLTQKQLYSRVKQWIATTWTNPKEVIQVDDPDGGYICIKGTHRAATDKGIDMGYYHYTVNIWLKDGRYKYEIINIYREHLQYAVNNTYQQDIDIATGGKKSCQQVVADMYDTAQGMVRSLEAKMKETTPSGGSDW